MKVGELTTVAPCTLAEIWMARSLVAAQTRCGALPVMSSCERRSVSFSMYESAVSLVKTTDMP